MRLAPGVALSVLLAGCEDPGWQQQLDASSIHQSLSVSFDASTTLVRATAELRRGGAAGEVEELAANDRLLFNGQNMTREAGGGTPRYGFSQLGARVGEQIFTWRTSDRGDLENRIAWVPVTALSATASTRRAQPRIALELSTAALTADDRIELTLRQSSDELEIGVALDVSLAPTLAGTLQAVGTVPAARLPAFAAGAATVTLSRVRSRTVEQGAVAGGTIRAVYRAAPIAVTLTD